MISCGKAVGILVSNGNLGWDNLIQFACQREDSKKSKEQGGQRTSEFEKLYQVSITIGVQELRVVKPPIRGHIATRWLKKVDNENPVMECTGSWWGGQEGGCAADNPESETGCGA